MKLPKAYEAENYEKQMYELWEQSGVFIADPKSSKKHFSIAMPPPNETSVLHLGSALFVTLQDIMARYQRQQGKDVLWLPGTDHAAIATNTLVEKMLAEQGVDKHELGREEFVKKVKQFVADNRGQILNQLRAMGASCDWSRLRYTLDETLNRCVNETFVKMYNDGLIYRGHRIVNWDPKLETTVSDDEVEHKEETAPLYTLQYGPFQIATARPETKFGDKYVVMHPDDKRYAQYKHGDTFEVEWLNGKITATVIKDEAVESEFGTGVMTITPWHDRTDFEIAERHGLEKEQIIDFKGKLLPIADEFKGMQIDEARPKIVEKLDKMGLLVSVDDRPHNVALNSRGKGVIEPQIMLQWFVDVNRPTVEWKGQLRSLKEVMRAVVEDGDIKIIPKRFEKIYFQWIDNLYDWCVSRQIWWGHQIPVWYRGEDEVYTGVEPPKGESWKQDNDTLDTWFSSALWTWSTLVDPELAKDISLPLDELLAGSVDFQTYHPTSVLETGWDILFFWVARMVLSTTYMTGQVPFRTVYLHGLVRTETGKKMSKSDPDSIIDPMEMIGEFGTDALRLALIQGMSAGADQRVGKSKIVANRNFANKLWNIARYVQETGVEKTQTPTPKTPQDHWILNKLSISASAIGIALDDFKFSEAYDALYHFVWDDLADWYIEASKDEPNREVLTRILADTLIIAHPFAPFVTETIWQNLDLGGLLAERSWPETSKSTSHHAIEFEKVKEIIAEVRKVIADTVITKPDLLHKDSKLIKENSQLIKRMGRLGDIKASPQPSGLRLITEDAAWLDVDQAIIEAYRHKLEASKNEQISIIKLLEKRLANKSYVKSAPGELVAQSKKDLLAAKDRLKVIEKELATVHE